MSLLPPKIAAPASENDAGDVVNIIKFLRNEEHIVQKNNCGPCPCPWPLARAFGSPPLTHLAAMAAPNPALYHCMNGAYKAASLSTMHACALPARRILTISPIVPSCDVEGEALPQVSDNFRGLDLAALLEPMIQRAPIQIFWGHIQEPPPFQTVIREQGVHVTIMVDQQLAFTQEVGLQSRRARLLWRTRARLLNNLRLLWRCYPTTM